MNPSLNESFLQGQPDISYSNQTTTPTDTQNLIVSQPDQPVQPTQSTSDHVTVPIPHNDYQSQQISGQQGNRSYLGRYIPEEVSDYISQDRLGNIRLTADLNKMLGLGRCLFVLAILEIIGYGFQTALYLLSLQLHYALISLIYIMIPITFFRGYKNLIVVDIKSYKDCRFIVIILDIIFIIMFFLLSTPKFGEKETIQVIVCIVQLVFYVFLISFPLLLGLLGFYH